MEKIIANEILATLHESSYVVDKILGELKGACPEEPFHACAMLLAYVMSDMFDNVMAPMYDEHPDLAPDWYREGPPRGRPAITPLKLPLKARQALLDAFETAYEKVQAAGHRLSQLPDPLEVALYAQGIHQVSVSLCRARVTLLMADVE
ncbi:hypothetical protein [Polyangium fumosum]|uniref:Uncharacterized protein n=1 Tax=Polyangium fumosum TaxID=889272 RepID=A0A4U1JGU1_9BACT|nr:hypothetical protein [Polyangium fumosum]TKD09910.1 hypothetical protein E8A74_09870 [Polyangium fumosum]